MKPGHFLAKGHGISDYEAVTSKSTVQPKGFIYVETDRYLPAPKPDIPYKDFEEAVTDSTKQLSIHKKLENWAKEPLEELRFLRRIVEGTPKDGDIFLPGDGDKMSGCVVWAPFHLPHELFETYLQLAEDISGPRLWQRIVGFRYLVQGIREENTIRRLLESQEWLQNILRLRSGRGGKGWSFDIGIDTHGGGVWQAEAAADMVEKVRHLEKEGDVDAEKVRFILNHLCKPDLSTSKATSGSRWLSAMERLAAQPAVYMKLSGAFNEFAPSPTPADVPSLLDRLDFYTRNVFKLFGSRKVMFGSDWPVCNVGGPKSAENWALWREVVAKLLEKFEIVEVEDVWWRTGCEAYGVEL